MYAKFYLYSSFSEMFKRQLDHTLQIIQKKNNSRIGGCYNFRGMFVCICVHWIYEENSLYKLMQFKRLENQFKLVYPPSPPKLPPPTKNYNYKVTLCQSTVLKIIALLTEFNIYMCT